MTQHLADLPAAELPATVEDYRSLLAALTERGYEVRDFHDATAADGELLLRHDVDVSPAAAVALAAVEHQLGLRASYFVMLRSPLYNPLAPGTRAELSRLIELGHEIGLHFDASIWPGDDRSLDRAAAHECTLLEEIVEAPVRAVSFHRPVRALLGRAAAIGGRIHTYQPAFFSNMAYVSDSRGGWHHGHPLEQDAVRNGQALQLLTHPIWWVGEPGDDVNARLDRLVLERRKSTEDDLSDTIDSYRPPTTRR